MSSSGNATPYYNSDPATLLNLAQFSSINAKTLDFMLHQIKNYVRQLLQSVTIVYKSNNIVFPVHQYFDGILRMVSPVELNALININYIKCMFQEPAEISKPNQNQKKKKNKAQNENIMNFINLEDDQYLMHQIRKINQGRQQIIVHPKKSSYKTKSFGGKNGRHTVRSRGLQDQILMWITNQLQKGKVLTKPQIMMKGRQLGKPFSFKACPRWCDNFLNRNPEIKTQMYKRLYIQGTYRRRYDQEQIACIEDDGSTTKKQKGQQKYKLHAESIYDDQSFNEGYYQIDQIQSSKENGQSQMEKSAKMEELDDEEAS